VAIACGLVACGGAEPQAAAAVASNGVGALQAVTSSHPALEAHLAAVSAGASWQLFARSPVRMRCSIGLSELPAVLPQPSGQPDGGTVPTLLPETGNYLGIDGEAVVALGPISGGQVLTVGARSDFACQVLPRACGPVANVGRIAAGIGYSLAVRADGSVLQWGELGNTTAGSWVPGTTAIKLDTLGSIVGVKAGGASAALDASGSVHSWGENYYGALGITPQGIADNLSQPTPNALIGKVKDVVIDGSAYEMMTLFVRLDGTVGYTPKTRGRGPVAVGTVTGLSGVESLSGGKGRDFEVTRGYAVKADGTVWALNWKEVFASGGWQHQLVAEQVRGVAGIVQLSCTVRYCLAASKEGSVWAWGDGAWGSLGDGTGLSSDLPVKALGLLTSRKSSPATLRRMRSQRRRPLCLGRLGGGAVSQAYYRAHEDDFKRPQVLVESRFGVPTLQKWQPFDHAAEGRFRVGLGDNSAGQVGDGTKDTYDGRISRVLGINLN
jgi:hypothetical protein